MKKDKYTATILVAEGRSRDAHSTRASGQTDLDRAYCSAVHSAPQHAKKDGWGLRVHAKIIDTKVCSGGLATKLTAVSKKKLSEAPTRTKATAKKRGYQRRAGQTDEITQQTCDMRALSSSERRGKGRRTVGGRNSEHEEGRRETPVCRPPAVAAAAGRAFRPAFLRFALEKAPPMQQCGSSARKPRTRPAVKVSVELRRRLSPCGVSLFAGLAGRRRLFRKRVASSLMVERGDFSLHESLPRWRDVSGWMLS